MWGCRRRLELLMRPSSSSGMQTEDRMSVTTINASATQVSSWPFLDILHAGFCATC